MSGAGGTKHRPSDLEHGYSNETNEQTSVCRKNHLGLPTGLCNNLGGLGAAAAGMKQMGHASVLGMSSYQHQANQLKTVMNKQNAASLEGISAQVSLFTA